VKVATTAAGFYPNTATVTDSGTPLIEYGNNTYVALAPVVSLLCSSGTLAAGGTLTGVVNTYYPGTASVSVGATSIPIGAANVLAPSRWEPSCSLFRCRMRASRLEHGCLRKWQHGNWIHNDQQRGNYEFVTATGPISAGSVPILGAGVGGGLVLGTPRPQLLRRRDRAPISSDRAAVFLGNPGSRYGSGVEWIKRRNSCA